MSDLNEELDRIVEYKRASTKAPLIKVKHFDVPKGVNALLSFSDGFITSNRIFRVFGSNSDPMIPSLDAWNDLDWIRGYGDPINDILFICDDIFGDQYGYFFGRKRTFVKFYCEGGSIEEIPGGINEFIEGVLDGMDSHLVDRELLKEAFDRGLKPNANEHLAFEMPLVVGGERAVDNLNIESVALHLGTLSQLTQEGKKHSEGQRIRRFGQ